MTTDGRIKILDFGLARLTVHEAAPETQTATFDPPTSPGVAMGTIGYMSPEQARGFPADARSDIFSLGAILYEMLSGRRAFKRETAADTMSAILNDDPPELAGSSAAISPGLDRVVHRCLEKRPEQRFHSAHDLGLALEAVSASGSLPSPAITAPTAPRRRWRSALAIGLGLLALLAAFLAGEPAAERPPPTYRRITFRRGAVGSARFSPDGQAIVYAAHWGTDPWAVFSSRLGSTEARPLGLPGADVVATSGSEIAVVLGNGTLARVPMDGGTPREILEGVDSADWTRDGTRFAVVWNVEDHQRLEYPIGKVVFETTGLQRIGSPRLSPSGDLVAFLDRPAGLTDPGADVAVVDLPGRKRGLSKAWVAMSGLAWSPNGREVWFTATRAGSAQALHAVTLSGQERLVARVPGSLSLHDIAPDGRVLLTQGQNRWETRGRMAGDAAERDLSWLDATLTPVLSPDGTRMVFQEWGEGGSAAGSTYLRKLDGSPAVRLADGAPYAVSPDWKWVLCGTSPPMQELRLVPIGAGETKTLPRGSVSAYRWAWWHPDGKRIVFQASEAGRPARVFVQELPAGLPHPISPEGVNPTSWFNLAISPDGHFYTSRPPGPRVSHVLYPIDGGEPRSIPGLEIDDEPFQWSDDGRSLFVQVGVGRDPTRVEKLDVQTGRRQPWLELTPPDRAGLQFIGQAMVTPNGRYYTYFYQRGLSDLYVVEGLR